MKRIKGEKCRLSDLKIGQLCKILSNEVEDKELKIHLLEMGLLPETSIKMKKKAPFGEPIVIELRGYELFMEKKELRQIYVQVS